MQGEVLIDTKKADVPLLIVPEGINKQLAIQEQELSGKKVKVIKLTDVIPLDNHERLIAILKGRKGRTDTSIFSDKRVWLLLGGATVIGVLLGYFISR
jgi:hypothetical protein